MGIHSGPHGSYKSLAGSIGDAEGVPGGSPQFEVHNHIGKLTSKSSELFLGAHHKSVRGGLVAMAGLAVPSATSAQPSLKASNSLPSLGSASTWDAALVAAASTDAGDGATESSAGSPVAPVVYVVIASSRAVALGSSRGGTAVLMHEACPTSHRYRRQYVLNELKATRSRARKHQQFSTRLHTNASHCCFS